MQAQALYRQMRPLKFCDLVGQAPIARAIANQVASGRLGHAFLFCGTRGTGKTSAARILARAINCKHPDSGEPCNSCELCRAILAERCLDVAEIDAASNNGVEYIRELNQEVKFLPTMGSAKVYIVDEVHMLSNSAFNALLKTLEEPPPNVFFILATTEPAKIPATIISRCQRYDFRRISIEDCTMALGAFLDNAGFLFEREALEYIAYHSDGAMRDAISILDKCMSMGDLTLANVRAALLAVDEASLFEFGKALYAGDAAAVIGIIAQSMDAGRDARQFCEDAIKHLRDVLVAKLTGGAGYSSAHKTKLLAQGETFETTRLIRLVEGMSAIVMEMRQGYNARTILEVGVLRQCVETEAEQTSDKPQARPQLSTQTTPQAPGSVRPRSDPTPTPLASYSEAPPAHSEVTSSQQLPPPPDATPSTIAQSWNRICAEFTHPLKGAAQLCGARAAGAAVEIFSEKTNVLERVQKFADDITATITKMFGSSPELVFTSSNAYNTTADAQSSQAADPRSTQNPATADWNEYPNEPFDESDWDALLKSGR